MVMNIGCRGQICSSFSGSKSFSDKKTSENAVSAKTDTFIRSSKPEEYDTSACGSTLEETRKKIMEFVSLAKRGNSYQAKYYPRVSPDDYKGKSEIKFDIIRNDQKLWNDGFAQKLEKAGVPADISLEFDYDYDTGKSVITKISDENYRETVESILNNQPGYELKSTAYASRIMNGSISSVYYSVVRNMLDIRFGQDIKELYVDESGNLQGANNGLLKALENERAGKNDVIKGSGFDYDSRLHFGAKNVEALIKRLITDENITPNISHMGYGKAGLYTDDGDFKFGGEIDMSILDDERTAMRGAISAYGNPYGYDLWLNSEEKF